MSKRTFYPDIAKVVQWTKEQGYFAGFQRIDYTNYDLEHALQLVEALGKSRRPYFCIDEDNRFTYENLIKWCHADPTLQALDPETSTPRQGNLNAGIYIAGNAGTGKSWCIELMQVYCKALGLKIRFTEDDSTRPLHWYIYRADDVCADFAEKGNTTQYRRHPLLALQDFGQEPKETLYMGNRQNVMKQLLEHRGDRTDLITLITSNLPIRSERLKEHYGYRVQSRLYEMCNYYEIKGKDRRKR